jgi:hypothetical protein
MTSDYKRGRFETQRFADRNEGYYEGLRGIMGLGFSTEDLIHYFPSFAGHMTLSRYLVMYEAYKMTLGVAGHIAELGVYKAAGSLLFAKLVQIFEPEAFTLVHGFDWFEGTLPTHEEPNIAKGSYCEDYDRVMKLVHLQKLDRILHIHKVDLRTDLKTFFEENAYMQFKLAFFDAGQYDIVAHGIQYLWPRIVPGGILLLDQFNHELSPGETRAVREHLPNAKIKTFPFGWLPSAYIIKE